MPAHTPSVGEFVVGAFVGGVGAFVGTGGSVGAFVGAVVGIAGALVGSIVGAERDEIVTQLPDMHIFALPHGTPSADCTMPSPTLSPT